MNKKLENMLNQEGVYAGVKKILRIDYVVVKKLGIEDVIQETLQTALQKEYESKINEGDISRAKKIEKYAQEKGIQLNLETTLQKAYETKLNEGDISRAKKIEEYAKEKGIHVSVDKETLQKTLQKAYETKINKGEIDKVKNIEKYAQEKGIQLEGEKEDIKIEKNLEGIAFIGIYGTAYNGKMNQKFVLGKDEEGTLNLIFDDNYGYHSGISENYRLDALGGGWMEIDVNQKKIRVYSRSGDFGYEPRLITAVLLQKAFPDWHIKIEE